MISAYTLRHLREEAEGRCPRCWGRGYTLYERDNPMAAEPCGCMDRDAEEEEEDADESASS